MTAFTFVVCGLPFPTPTTPPGAVSPILRFSRRQSRSSRVIRHRHLRLLPIQFKCRLPLPIQSLLRVQRRLQYPLLIRRRLQYPLLIQLQPQSPLPVQFQPIPLPLSIPLPIRLQIQLPRPIPSLVTHPITIPNPSTTLTSWTRQSSTRRFAWRRRASLWISPPCPHPHGRSNTPSTARSFISPRLPQKSAPPPPTWCKSLRTRA